MRIDPDTCRDPDLLAAEVRRLQGVIAAGEAAINDEERAPRTYRKTDGKRPIADMSGANAKDQKIATMETDTMNDDARDPSASRGSHGDAIGWVMFKNGKMAFDVVWTDGDEAEKYCLGAYSGTAEVVGVYRQPQPTLTDEEREALRHAEEATAGMIHVYTDERPGFDISEKLRWLRERLG